MRSASWRSRSTALGLVLAVAVVGAACSSTNSSSTTTTAASTSGSSGSGGSRSIPQSAFSDHTGVTSSSVQVANVSTLSLGLFKGAQVGAQAYADYVNSTGGVNGRRIVVNSADDSFTGAGNKQATTNALQSDFAMVGNFSLEDSFGGAVLAQNPGFADVSQILDNATNKLPNVYSPIPLADGWASGPMTYYHNKFKADASHAGAFLADSPSATQTWQGEKYVAERAGFTFVSEQTYATTQTDFNQQVIAMKNAGVKIIFMDQMPGNYASSVLKALAQQNFHPQVLLGAATYSNQLVSQSGGAANVDGAYLSQNLALYLGTDQAAVPAVATFLHWVQVASPGFNPDLFTAYGWLSADLFVQGLKNAGSNPSRGSLLQALSKITSFNGNGFNAPSDPATKTPPNCYLIATVTNGQFVRSPDNPPTTGSTQGFRCDGSYIVKPGT
ncbi:MAG TPA: ABC transporter substrate-binding protein [Acidimicrobiales bacterium]|nr:ABC transporter substrate-binding protein [Acidimicrobiales bacterium]